MTGNESRTAHHLRLLTSAQKADASLLEQFVCETDAVAFAELVRRHGPMVLGVCRRVLGNDADADDAFQATFLVLARKAGAVRNVGSLASWLFGVARFAALKARDRDRRRREHETRAARNPLPQAGPGTELLAAVDEELERLPDRYRAPLVACFLQGLTQEEAARQLRCSLSTLRRRLERGQELLRRRLAGRGIVPALGALGAGIGAKSASVSAGVVEAATALAVVFLKGSTGPVPAAVLAQEVTSMMSRTGWKALLTALAVGIGLVGGGAAWQLGAQPKDPTQNPKGAPKVAPKAGPPAEPKGAPKTTTGERIKVGDKLTIQAKEIFVLAPLDQIFEVDADGQIDLTDAYSGKVKVAGLTLEEASAAVTAQLRINTRRGEAKLSRFVPAGPLELENRVRALEKEVKALREAVDELRAKRHGSGP